MRLLKEICRGSLLGVANIMPGVSGGALAISMGIYDKIIYAITHLRKDLKNSIRILTPIGIGVVLGFAGLSFVIRWLFEEYPLQTNLLFVGLVLGGIPEILKPIRAEKVRTAGILAFFFFFFLVAALPMLNISGKEAVMDLSFATAVKMFGIGIISAATMVVPGVSGSMILLLIGYYQPLLDEITGCIQGFLTMNADQMIRGVLILAPAVLGLGAGIIVIAKIVEYLLAHHKTTSYWGILGLIIASPVGILAEMRGMSFDAVSVLTGVPALLIGLFAANRLGDKES
nr:DUF368 domain-containing protein [uncultured Anaerostipes sp.]